MPDGRVCCGDGVVWSAGNDEQNVVADDWRCLRLEYSSRPDTAALCRRDIGGLLHQAVPDFICHIESVQLTVLECPQKRN